MNRLPQDPYMLLSTVNMKLRDRYASLDDLCDDLQADRQTLEAVLATIGYYYDTRRNAFLPGS